MIPMRNRTSVHAGLLTALSVGMVALAGCTAFNPSPAAPTGPAASGAPSGVSPSAPASAVPLALKFRATVGGQPLTAPKLRLTNALTGEVLAEGDSSSLVAAGAGNYALSQVPRLPIQVIQGVISFEPVILLPPLAYLRAEFFAGDFFLSGSFRVGPYADGQAQGGQGGLAPIDVNPRTTIADALMAGARRLAQNLNPEAAEKMLAAIEADQAKLLEKLSSLTPDQETALANALGTSDSDAPLTVAQIQAALNTAGVSDLLPQDDIADIVSNSLAVYATAARDGATLTAGANPDIAGLFPDSLNVSLQNNTFVYTDTNGQQVTVSFGTATPAPTAAPTGAPTNTPTAAPTTAVEPEVPDEDLDTVAVPGTAVFSDSAKFSPDVELSATNNQLTMRVQQDAGEDDVLQIVARIIKADYGAVFNPQTTLASSTGSNLIFQNQAATHQIVDDNTFPDEAINLSARMGGGSLTTPAYNGTWKLLTPFARDVAQVQVFDEAESLFVALRYKMGNTAVTTNSGNTTQLITAPNVLTFDASDLEDLEDSTTGQVEIDIYSRNGNFAQYTENIKFSGSSD